LNLLVGRALQRGTPLTLILPNHVFRHVAEYSCKSMFRKELPLFSPWVDKKTRRQLLWAGRTPRADLASRLAVDGSQYS
jgi:hypothetical protein